MKYYLPPPREFTDEELEGFDKLGEKVKKFAHYYLTTRKPVSSAIKAGFSREKARSAANRLLQNKKVRRYIEYLKAQMRQMAEVDRDYIVLKLKEIVEKENASDQVKISALNTLAKIGGFLQDSKPPQTFVLNVIGLDEEKDKVKEVGVSVQFDKVDKI
ncbi:MAG: hypothetical protein DRH57_00130 [Candidatus Cloacimonadota bacterium]|nr:MAG: hypothetical protein DRH57_00130 [Candidatus Cloacimonadota bacterium]